MWYLVEAEEKFNSPKGLKDIPLYTCTKWLSLPEKTLFLALVSPAEKRALLWSPAGKQFLWCQYFSINPNSALFFLELTRMGFSWESWVQRPTVNEQVFILEGVMNYVDPMGFLGGKERIISNTHKKWAFIPFSFISEYTDLRSESRKRGLQSPIAIKLCKKSPQKGAKLMH